MKTQVIQNEPEPSEPEPEEGGEQESDIAGTPDAIAPPNRTEEHR